MCIVEKGGNRKRLPFLGGLVENDDYNSENVIKYWIYNLKGYALFNGVGRAMIFGMLLLITSLLFLRIFLGNVQRLD